MAIKMMTAALLAMLAGTANAQTSPSHPRRLHFYLAGDYYFPGNASHNGINDVPNDVPNNDETDLVDSLAQASQLQASENYSGGFGGRAGALYDIGKYFAAGLNVGYVKGPTITKSVSGNAPFTAGALSGSAAVSASDELRSNAVRIMAEARPTLPLSDNWTLTLGLAAGVAIVHLTESQTLVEVPDTLLLTIPQFSSSGSTTYSGFAYELSPMISFKGLGAGLRYAGFPSYGGSSTVAAFKWTTWGPSVEYKF